MKHHVAAADRVEDRVAQREVRRGLGGPIFIAQVAESGQEGEVHEAGQGERAGDAMDLLGRRVANFLNDLGEVARQAGGKFEADSVGELAGG